MSITGGPGRGPVTDVALPYVGVCLHVYSDAIWDILMTHMGHVNDTLMTHMLTCVF